MKIGKYTLIKTADLRHLIEENNAFVSTNDAVLKRVDDEREKYLDLAESVRDTAAKITSLLDELSCESYADV